MSSAAGERSLLVTGKIALLEEKSTEYHGAGEDGYPMNILAALIVFFAGALALLLTGLVRRNAVHLGLVQVPNDRSSHTTPTPSGGGIGIAIASLVAGAALIPSGFDIAAWFVSLLAAVLGLFDDRLNLSARLRLIVQTALVVGLLIAAGHMPSISVFGFLFPQAGLYLVLTICGVWWINLFNFMDGIDGIAASESAFLLVGLLFLAQSGPDMAWGWLGWWAMAITASSLGFLVLNWSPAKIFMGDAGSNFLAVAIFSVALGLIAKGLLHYSAVIILAGLFVADATVTLAIRAVRGEQILSAHRSHAYQRLSRKWRNHGKTTLVCIAVNVIWLYPLATWAQREQQLGWLIAIVAYIPLIAVCIWLGAGRPDVSKALVSDFAAHEE